MIREDVVAHLAIFSFLPLLLLSCRTGTSAEIALEQYRSAVQRDDPKAAYELLSKERKSALSLQQFQAQWREVRPELQLQLEQLSNPEDVSITYRALATLPSGAQIALRSAGGPWQLEEGIGIKAKAGTPFEAVRALILALEQRSWQQALGLLARQKRESLEREIQDKLSQLKRLLGGELEITGDRARLQNGPASRLELIREDGQWRVLDIE